MISVDTMSFQNPTSQEMHTNRISKIYCTNRNNSTQTYPIDLAKSEESQIAMLEKSLDFLRTQHEIMLKSLQEEIEQLRKTNKALQFRLVMCCCTSNKEGINDQLLKKGCGPKEVDQERQISELKRQLEEEKQKNSLLEQQISIAHPVQKSGTELPKHGHGPSSKHRHDHEPPVAKLIDANGVDDTWEIESGRHKNSTTRKSINSIGNKATEFTEISKVERAQHPGHNRLSGTTRIASPELNAESSSSAILLSPNTVIDTPDGFWVRPSIAALQNPATSKPGSASPRSSKVSGHIMPIKLPVLRTNGSIHQVTVKDTNKDVQVSKPSVSKPDETPITLEGGASPKRSSNQSNESRQGRTCKSVKNIVKMYEAARNSITRGSEKYAASPENANHPKREPFLPALVKPERNKTNLAKRLKEFEKKHQHRDPNHNFS